VKGTLNEWSMLSADRHRDTDERYMQASFNVLAQVRPDLAEQVRGVLALDPYYVDFDSAIAEHFYEWVAEHWLDNQPPDVVR